MFKNANTRLALLGAALLLSVVACGGTDPDVGDTEPTSSTSTVPPIGTSTTTSSAAATTTSTPITTTTTTTPGTGAIEIAVSVEAGAVEGGGRISVELDADVRLVVTADVTDVVHVHGYELLAAVAPGAPAILEFVADIPGIFDVEMESSGLELVELVVEP